MPAAPSDQETKDSATAESSVPEDKATKIEGTTAGASSASAASNEAATASSTGSVANSNGTPSPKTPSSKKPHYVHPHPGHSMYYPYPPYDPAAYAATVATVPEVMNDTTDSTDSLGDAHSSNPENKSPGSSPSKSAAAASPSAGSPTAAPVPGHYPPPLPPHYMAQYPYPHHPHAPPPPHHHAAAAAYHRWAEAAAASGYPPPPPPPHHHHPGYPHPHYDPYAAAAHAHAYAAKSPPKPAERSSHGSPGAASTPGPYRFSDTTLRRDALARLNSPGKKKGTTPASSPFKAGTEEIAATANGSPQVAVLPYAIMDLEARAEGATSPSQIEEFHREEVTTMGCTCKKTKCLKLYCQCFGVKIYCGHNCRCLSCHNLPQFDLERETAIRIILTRNPNAFETKFQKNTGLPVTDPAAMAATRNQDEASRQPGSLPMPARILSHKLGCKCRKSACMKKYCECYAGNVKCSSNCRCVGCKNVPLAGFDDDKPPNQGAASVKKDSAWKEAAYSLAFLKHGSTPEKPARTNSSDKSEAGSMPSLASEESPVRAKTAQKQFAGAATMPPPNTSERAAVNALQSSEKTAVNALLMAARAMVGGGIGGQGTTARRLEDDDDPESSSSTATPTVKNACNDDYVTPDTSMVMEDEQFETPQKNLLHKFTSPKRKAHETQASSGAAGSSVKAGPASNNTPAAEFKIKRSRVGSLRKRASEETVESRDSDGEAAVHTNGTSMDMDMSTPAKGTSAVADLTPVSARCIDFKKMHVNDSTAV